MAKQFSRVDRVTQELSRLLATLIQREVRDPKVGMLTITRIDVSRDMAYAKIYFLTFDESDGKDCQAGLNRAAGFLRTSLSQVMTMRSVPKLRFLLDTASLEGNKVQALIDRLPDLKSHNENSPES